MQYLARSAVAAATAMASSLNYAQPAHIEISDSDDKKMGEKVSQIISRPKTPEEFDRNLKFISDHDLLLRDDFYSENNIKDIFTLKTVEIVKDNKGTLIISSDFAGIFPKKIAPEAFGGSAASASFVGGKTIRGAELISAALNFRIYEGGPSFEVAKQIFGGAFVLMPPMPYLHGSKPVATGPHGNEAWIYETTLGELNKSVTLGFNPAGQLSAVIISYEKYNKQDSISHSGDHLEQQITASTNDFDSIFPRRKASESFGRSVASASLLIIRTVHSSGLISVILNFWMNDHGLDFQKTKGIFGDKFVRLMPTAYEFSQTGPATSPHGNETWRSEQVTTTSEKIVTLGFSSTGDLSNVLIEVKQNQISGSENDCNPHSRCPGL